MRKLSTPRASAMPLGAAGAGLYCSAPDDANCWKKSRAQPAPPAIPPRPPAADQRIEKSRCQRSYILSLVAHWVPDASVGAFDEALRLSGGSGPKARAKGPMQSQRSHQHFRSHLQRPSAVRSKCIAYPCKFAFRRGGQRRRHVKSPVERTCFRLAGPPGADRRYRAFASASTAYAVAASLMNLPASEAGSRCLLSEAANHAPVAGS